MASQSPLPSPVDKEDRMDVDPAVDGDAPAGGVMAPLLQRIPWSEDAMDAHRESLGLETDDYGALLHIDDWGLTLRGVPYRGDGLIVQKITRTLKVERRPRTEAEQRNWDLATRPGSTAPFIDPGGGGPWEPVPLDEVEKWAEKGKSFHLDCMEYWECFDVTAGVIQCGDQFESGAFRPRVGRDYKKLLLTHQYRGTYTISGEAQFYPLSAREKRALLRRWPGVELANELKSTRQNPTPDLARFFPQKEGVSHGVKLTVTSTWNSNVEFGDSDVKVDRGHFGH